MKKYIIWIEDSIEWEENVRFLIKRIKNLDGGSNVVIKKVPIGTYETPIYISYFDNHENKKLI